MKTGRPVRPYREGEERIVHVRLDTELTRAFADFCRRYDVGAKTVVSEALRAYLAKGV